MEVLNFKFIVTMKKNYLLFAILALSFSGIFAQTVEINDDMESYTVGTSILQDHWTSWSGTAADAMLSSNAQAHGGSKSGFVDGSTTIDAVLDTGNKIFGTWWLSFYMYIPAGKEGYYNWQGTVPIGSGEWVVGNIYFNEGGDEPGSGYIDYSSGDAADWVYFTYPEGQWFEVVTGVDITSGISLATWEMWVDGVEVVSAGTPFADAAGTPGTSLGGIDFYSISANNEYYIDDVTYQDGPFVGVNDFAQKGFSAFPNPVNNILNLKANENITSVAIYNVLGQQVYSAKVNALTSQVDMSQMASGAYFVKVNVNGSEGTVKVVK